MPVDTKKGCKNDSDCPENYICRLPTAKSNNGKKKMSEKFRHIFFGFIDNGTCVLKGNYNKYPNKSFFFQNVYVNNLR